jgi:hypothetical protein
MLRELTLCSVLSLTTHEHLPGRNQRSGRDGKQQMLVQSELYNSAFRFESRIRSFIAERQKPQGENGNRTGQSSSGRR